MLRRPVEFAQYTSIAYTDRLAELGVAPSIGTVADSYDKERLHSELDDHTPAEVEAAYYRDHPHAHAA